MKYTLLVNKKHLISEKQILAIAKEKFFDYENKEILVEKECLKAYLNLKKYLESKNIIIEIDSAYRSIEYQQELMDRLKKEKCREYVEKYVAKPGASEHHTGMALDIIIKIGDVYYDEETAELEIIYSKIHESLSKFGFILRYPKGKEEITGYAYEPWHIRYVGLIPAKVIYENYLTLEEYHQKFGCILYLNKPVGITSYDVVDKVKRAFGLNRVGHSGTLDPLASGVLVVTVGNACKIVELLTAEDKEYIAGVELGIKTDTYDITGKVLDTKEVAKDINLEEVLNSFKKTYLQEVPIYSAIKVNGKKLYEYAREDKEVELPKREVTIKEIELLEKNNNQFTFRTLVTKGCYIRSLIVDIAKELDTYATMTSLIRTKQGDITLEEANTLEDLVNNCPKLHKIEEVLDYPVIVVDSSLEKKLRNGVKVSNDWNIKDKVIFKNSNNELIGIYERINNELKTWKNFL